MLSSREGERADYESWEGWDQWDGWDGCNDLTAIFPYDPHPAYGHVDSLAPARSALTGFRLRRTPFAVSPNGESLPLLRAKDNDLLPSDGRWDSDWMRRAFCELVVGY